MSDRRNKLVCQFEIDEEAAAALALFLKRLTFDDWHEKTDPSRTPAERMDHAYWMRNGCEAVERGLRWTGKPAQAVESPTQIPRSVNR